MDQLLEVAVSKLQIRIAGCDDLALFRQTETAVHTPWRLGANAAIGGSPAARDRAAATMENSQRNIMFLRNLCDTLLPLIQRPVRHDISAILVAIGIADHDHLLIIAGDQMLA